MFIAADRICHNQTTAIRRTIDGMAESVELRLSMWQVVGFQRELNQSDDFNILTIFKNILCYTCRYLGMDRPAVRQVTEDGAEQLLFVVLRHSNSISVISWR